MFLTTSQHNGVISSCGTVPK